MNIKVWIFIAIVLAVLVIGFLVGRNMKKNAECSDCKGDKIPAGAAVTAATGTGANVVSNAAVTKQGMNIDASQKG